MRAGTENVASIVGMAVALKKNCERIQESTRHLLTCETVLIEKLNNAGIDFVRNGSDNHIPGNISLSFRSADGETLLHRLDLMGICVSTGAACDSVNTQVSHVLSSIGIDVEYSEGTIRVSLGIDNTCNDIAVIAESIIRVIK